MAHRIKLPASAFSNDTPKRETRGRKPVVIEAHRKWIRSLPGLIDGATKGVEAAHISKKDAKSGKVSRGKAQKSDDFYLIPLSKRLHIEIHQIGEEAFERKYAVDLVRIALSLFALHGDDARAQIAIRQTFGGGSK